MVVYGLFDLVHQGAYEVAWDLCEEEGIGLDVGPPMGYWQVWRCNNTHSNLRQPTHSSTHIDTSCFEYGEPTYLRNDTRSGTWTWTR